MGQNNSDSVFTDPHAKEYEEILDSMQIDPAEGLSEKQVREQRKQYGENKLKETKSRSKIKIFIEQFQNIIILLLAVAAGLAFIFGNTVDGIAIIIVILINSLIGFYMEIRALQSLESLKEFTKVEAMVRREGKEQKVFATELVPGDIVLVNEGDLVTADIRLIEANKVSADESALTGESVPVGKTTEALDKDVPVAEKTNMLFKGTALTRGSGLGVVVSTGTTTELGKISELVETAEEEVTPLEKRLEKLATKLVWVILAIAAVVALSGIIAGKDMMILLETTIALAVAAVPEGLPIVATLALARGMWRMAKRNALMEQLSAVETLGSTSVILTDKTGTLTENRMTVTEYIFEGQRVEVTGRGLETDGVFKIDDTEIDPRENDLLFQAIEVGVLCNNANIPEPGSEDEEAMGDPMEIALAITGGKIELWHEHYLEEKPEEREEAFDPDVKMMATFNKQENNYLVAVKGAPESVLNSCSTIRTGEGEQDLTDEMREHWLEKNVDMAERGLRVLGLARKETDNLDEDPYENLTFLGLVGLLDPPREQVKETINAFQSAGIKMVMLTGDQAATAKNVAQSVSLIEDGNDAVLPGERIKSPENLSEDEKKELMNTSIFARCSPEQKLDLINLYQESGAIVAMTGDGINDAPALKKSDIGIAMGKQGTQVAQEAAHMVLLDDALSTVVTAIEYGRVIFDNIRKFVLYLLSGNVGEILAVGVAAAANWPLPLLPLQILYLNMINDVFPALALGIGKGHGHELEHPPRESDEPILTKYHWGMIGGYGVVIAATILISFFLAQDYLGMGPDEAVTISFLTLSVSRLFHAFNMRDRTTTFFRNEIVNNPWIWGAIVLSFGLLFLAVNVPFLANVLKVVQPGIDGWLFVIVLSLIPLVFGQLWKIVENKLIFDDDDL